MRHIKSLFLILMCISILTCCSVPTSVSELTHPLQQQLTSPGSGIQNFQERGIYPFREYEIVLYSYVQVPEENPQDRLPVFGYALVSRQGISWTVEQSRGFGGNPVPPIVAYDHDRINGSLLIFGQVLQANVQAVEVTFDTGQIVRDDAEDQVFAIVGEGASSLSELRVLGDDDTVLASYTQPKLTTN